MKIINLMEDYPKRNRKNIMNDRLKNKTSEAIREAKRFGWKYFDAKGYQYNGYFYDGRWIPIAKRFIEYYNLKPGSKILDIGCAKGYLVYDLCNLGMDAYGIDRSNYAIRCAPTEILNRVAVRDARELDYYDDNEFDLVLGINVIENLPLDECRKIIQQIERIGKNKFMRLDAWRNEEEKKMMENWAFTAITYLQPKDWINVLKNEGYTGEVYWFFP